MDKLIAALEAGADALTSSPIHMDEVSWSPALTARAKLGNEEAALIREHIASLAAKLNAGLVERMLRDADNLEAINEPHEAQTMRDAFYEITRLRAALRNTRALEEAVKVW